VRADSGQPDPAGQPRHPERTRRTRHLNRFNRLRAITVSAAIAPGYTLGEAIEWIGSRWRARSCPTAQIDFKGESREYQQSGSAVLFTFRLALLVVYLVLAAQFESFVHPLVIMLTVPLAVFGALLGLWPRAAR
jgi:multidrug efflux pump